MKFGIVVLNWNGKVITPRCLNSIYRGSNIPDATVVVDNASCDGSPQVIRDQFPQVVLIENDSNLGFAEGCNIGIRYLLQREFDLILLLNNDAEVDTGCLYELESAAQSYPAAAYAATIYEQVDRAKIWYSGGHINRLTLEGRHEIRLFENSENPRPTEFITGCCMLFRSEALRKIGLLDETFFAYYEDLDWCLRATATGERLLYVPKATIYHDISHSFRRAGSDRDGFSRFVWAQKRPLVLYLTYRNRALIARKHAVGRGHYVLLVLKHVIKAGLHAGLLLLIGQQQRAGATMKGLYDGLIGTRSTHIAEFLPPANYSTTRW